MFCYHKKFKWTIEHTFGTIDGYDLYIKYLSSVPVYYAPGILQQEKVCSLFLNVKDSQHFQSYYDFSSHLLVRTLSWHLHSNVLEAAICSSRV